MTWATAAWLLLGFELGAVHAAGIEQSARHPTAKMIVVGILRVAIVAVALAAAAMFGGILPAAAGWTLGFFARVARGAATTARTGQRRVGP